MTMNKLPDKYHTLVLDKWRKPIRLINAIRCTKLIVNEKALAYDINLKKYFSFEEWIRRYNYHQAQKEGRKHSVNDTFMFPVPEVISLIENVKDIYPSSRTPIGNIIRNFSKRKVFERDKNICGYCNTLITCLKDRTIDHIIPISKGGKSTYTNTVTCCKECNAKKADKSIEELGWTLHHIPTHPVAGTMSFIPKNLIKTSWEEFLL